MVVQTRDQLNGLGDVSAARQRREGRADPEQDRLPTSGGASDDLAAQQRIIEDIFMHAAAHSRTCDSARQRFRRVLRSGGPESLRITPDRDEVVELSETLGFLEMAVRDLCAALAPAAVERARMLANINPDPDQQTLAGLEGQRLDTFLRPIFTEAGIAGELITDARSRGTRG